MYIDTYDKNGKLIHSDKIISNMNEAEIIELAKENLVADNIASQEDLAEFTYKIRNS